MNDEQKAYQNFLTINERKIFSLEINERQMVSRKML